MLKAYTKVSILLCYCTAICTHVVRLESDGYWYIRRSGCGALSLFDIAVSFLVPLLLIWYCCHLWLFTVYVGSMLETSSGIILNLFFVSDCAGGAWRGERCGNVGSW